MPSVSNFQTALEGTLVTQISAAATTATVKVKKINGVTPTWLATAHRVTIIQKSRTVTKVEVVDVAAGTTQSGTTVTLGTMTRGLPLDGTGFTGSGTPQVFTSGAKVIVTWDAQAGRQTAFKDIANTFTDHLTLATTKELRLGGTSRAIYDDGNEVYIKSGTTAAKSLAQLAALSGSDEKVKITATDTTNSYLDDALLVTSPITKTTNNGGANETLTIALDTVPVTKGGTGIITGSTAYAPVFTGTTATGAFQAGTAGTTDQVLTSNGASAIATFQSPKDYVKIILSSAATSTTLTNPTTVTNFDTYTGTVPANFLTATTGGRFKIHFSGNRGTTTTVTLSFRLGNTSISSFALGSAGAGGFSGIFEGTFNGSASPGASVTVESSNVGFLASSMVMTQGDNTVATNGALTAQFGAVFGTTSGGNDITINHGYIELFSQTASTFA